MQGTGMDLEKRLVRNITILLLSNIFDYEFFGHIIAKLSWSVTDSGKIRNWKFHFCKSLHMCKRYEVP